MTDSDRHRPSCAATTRAGQPCRGAVLDGSSYCFAHAPELDAQRAEARARGGRNSATVARRWAGMPEPLRDVLHELRATLAELRAGQVSPAHASAAASLGRAIVATWDAAVAQDQLDQMEREIRAVTERTLRVVR